MASGLQGALSWRWTPFFALAAAAGVFAIGAAALLPEPVDRSEVGKSGKAAVSLDRRAIDASARADREEAASLQAEQREMRRARAASRAQARPPQRPRREVPDELSEAQRESVSFTRPARREPDSRDAPEEEEEADEVVPPPKLRPALGARLTPGALRNGKLMNRLGRPTLEEASGEDEDETEEEE